LIGAGASAVALSLTITGGTETSFITVVLFAISCNCCGCEAVESFDLLSSESFAGLIGGSISIGCKQNHSRNR
jgi:hypothetical protein